MRHEKAARLLELARMLASSAEGLTLDEMAERCGLGRSRFSHHCVELTNLTPAVFLLRRRMGAAMRMLCAERLWRTG